MSEHEGRGLGPRSRERLEQERGRAHENHGAGPERANERRGEGEQGAGDEERGEREGNLQRQSEREAEAGGRRSEPLRERKYLLLYGEAGGGHERKDPKRYSRGPSAETSERQARQADEPTDRGAKRPVAHVDVAVGHRGSMMRGDRERLDDHVRYQSTDCREGDEKEPGEALPSHVR